MREIKFRAFVIRSDAAENINKMRYESNAVIFGWEADGVTMKIMQFTGQANNKRPQSKFKHKNSRKITYKGQTKSISDWGDELRIPISIG